MKSIALIFLLICMAFYCQAQSIRGTVYDSVSNTALEFVNILDTKSLKGTITNSEGNFELDATFPTSLQFSFLGYETKLVTINSVEDTEELKIFMNTGSLFFEEIVLEGEKSNLGKQIIQKVIANKKDRKLPSRFSSSVYQQTTMTRIYKPGKKDSIQEDSIAIAYLNEAASTQYIRDEDYKQVIVAEIKQTGENDKQLKRMVPMISGRDFRGSSKFTTYNPIEYFTTPSDFSIDLYNNTYQNKNLTDRPITSAIANTALLNYTYRLKKIEIFEKDTLFTIAVRPRFKGAPLWGGNVIVSSNGYMLMKCDLSLDPGINGVKNFRLSINYQLQNDFLLATDKKIEYLAKMGSDPYEVKVTYNTSDYNFDPEFSRNFFGSEIVRYEESALKPDTELMLSYRGVALEKDLQIFFTEQDSIYRSITSDEYLEEQDSIFNSITWKKVVLGEVGRRNRAKGMTYRIDGILSSFQAFGVDGFRAEPGVRVNKEFLNSDEVDVRAKLSYGLTNNDIKGQGSIGYTFLPQKFARFSVGGGDIFDVITFYQSLDAIISRSNFINHRFVNAGYSMELINGLYFNSKVEFSDKKSVFNVKTNAFSDWVFGDQGTALDFEQYRILSLELDFIYRFGQKFMTRGRKKIVLPNYNPVLTFKYRKGIPGVFQSEVNFDYVELKFNQKLPSTKVGSLNYQLKAGSFVNKENLRQLEYNFFRGSTKYIFTNPLNDLLQIGETQSTPNTFFQAAGIHHFDGFFLDKIPLLNKLQLEILAGAGTLIIPANNLYHAEMYLGLGKKFRLWGETLQFAAYAVTSDNNLNKASIDYKFGINFYNAFAREWFY